MLLLYVVTGFSQRAYSAPSDTITKNRFSIGANFVYNLSSSRKAQSKTFPNGTLGTNYFSYANVFYIKYKTLDTKTFNVNLSYHKKLTKKLSFSFGLGLSQKKEFFKYLEYVDTPAYQPNRLYNIQTQYSVMLPLRMNYYFGRFIFSAGNNFNFSVSDIYTQVLENITETTKNRYSYTIYLQESVSYRLLRRDHLYVTVSAEQSPQFYKKYGYNHWLMLGFNWYF